MDKYFENPFFQRVMYGAILTFWIIANYYNNSYELESNKEPSFGIVYLWVFLFPAFIFLIQIIFNSYFGWFLSVILYLAFVGYITFSVINSLSNNLKPMLSHSKLDIFLLVFTLSILLYLGYILIRIKPIKSLF